MGQMKRIFQDLISDPEYLESYERDQLMSRHYEPVYPIEPYEFSSDSPKEPLENLLDTIPF